jgi:hypothetical protein
MPIFNGPEALVFWFPFPRGKFGVRETFPVYTSETMLVFKPSVIGWN